MTNSKNTWWVAFFVIAIVASVTAIALIRPGTQVDESAVSVQKKADDEAAALKKNTVAPFEDLSTALGVTENEMVDVGSIKRPARDLNFPKHEETESKSPFPNAGLSPALEWNENEQVTGLMAEIAVSEPNPQAGSAYFGADEFNRAEFEKNPKPYLAKIRPGRVFASAQPGKNVTPIQPEGSTYKELIQGEKAVLRTKGEPGMPVTFHAQELGEFQNRLKTITVAANEQGVAEAVYLAGPGTRGLINISAASPVHSEDVHFMVEVSVPN